MTGQINQRVSERCSRQSAAAALSALGQLYMFSFLNVLIQPQFQRGATVIRDEVRDIGITMGELEGENTEGTGQVGKLKLILMSSLLNRFRNNQIELCRLRRMSHKALHRIFLVHSIIWILRVQQAILVP